MGTIALKLALTPVLILAASLAGLFSFAAFFLALGLAVEGLGIALGFIAAGLLAVAVQVCSLWVLWQKGFVARGADR